MKATVEQLARIAAWKAANRERVRANQAAWYQANKDRIRAKKGNSPRGSDAERKKRTNAWRAKWRQRPDVRAREREQRRKYRSTPEYRAKVAAWWKSPEGRAYKRAWRSQPSIKAQTAAAHRRHKYGITDEQYLQMAAAQEGTCPGCLTVTELLCVDHDHATGAIRGLLCSPCNKAMGMARDDSATLRRLADYRDSFELGGG